MRTYTLVFSVLAHAIGVGAVIVMPALATDVLPEPRRATAFIVVRPVELPPPVAVRPQRRVEPASNTEAAPLTPPVGVSTEPVVEPVDPSGLAIFEPASVIPFGEFARGGEPVPPPVVPRPDPVRVGGVVQPPRKLVHVAPVYPPLALAARKEGMVILEAVLDEGGAVRDVRVLRSAQLLDEAAIAAVRQWRFTPTMLNGQPVPVVMTVTVSFSLGNDR